MESETSIFNEEDIISRWTRQDAIDAGEMFVIDPKIAKEAGITIPVVITQGVKALCDVPENLKGTQDYEGRLWDVLTVLVAQYTAKRRELKAMGGNLDPLRYTEGDVAFLGGTNAKHVERLWMVFDEIEGFTIMLPSEY